jgi:hypothetical protein
MILFLLLLVSFYGCVRVVHSFTGCPPATNRWSRTESSAVDGRARGSSRVSSSPTPAISCCTCAHRHQLLHLCPRSCWLLHAAGVVLHAAGVVLLGVVLLGVVLQAVGCGAPDGLLVDLVACFEPFGVPV